jgi:ketosteroid isomerase-like protein
MRKLLVLCLLIVSVAANAQSKKEREVIERSYLLSHTVFGTKDSLILEDLFAKKATYGHSGGKLENRQEAIANIAHNKSSYTDTSISDLSTLMYDDVAIVRFVFKGTETKADGKATALNLGMIMTWVREKGKWQLLARQAYKI